MLFIINSSAQRSNLLDRMFEMPTHTRSGAARDHVESVSHPLAVTPPTRRPFYSVSTLILYIFGDRFADETFTLADPSSSRRLHLWQYHKYWNFWLRWKYSKKFLEDFKPINYKSLVGTFEKYNWNENGNHYISTHKGCIIRTLTELHRLNTQLYMFKMKTTDLFFMWTILFVLHPASDHLYSFQI